jgi:hypothetical protein
MFSRGSAFFQILVESDLATIRALAYLAAFLILFSPLEAQVPATMLDQMSTADHLKQAGWWPRKGEAPRSDYVGAAVCAECHQAYAAGQSKHSMSKTAILPLQAVMLRDGAKFKIGPYSYDIYRKGDQEIYSVTDGIGTFSSPLIWAFGSGSRGQSYLFRHHEKLYEARISFFHGLGFNITPDHPQTPPDSLELAIGRAIPEDEEVKCFSCHTIASTVSGHFNPSQLMPGISCEGCHGPGASHVALANSGAEFPALIYNPARLTPAQSVDFCGACHRTWWDVSRLSGVMTIRFPAFRLEKSKCWGNGDKRLTCAACHNPHQPLQRDPVAYDVKCLACHNIGPVGSRTVASSQGGGSGPSCPIATSKCVSCHLPKYEVPSMRTTFTDHKIQIVTGKQFRE